MTRLVACLFAAALLAAPASVAHAAPGDGIAQACVQAYDVIFKAAQGDTPSPRHTNRVPLCNCLQEKVVADPKIPAADKDKVREVFVLLATDRKKAAELAETMSKESNRALDDYDNQCAAQHAK